MLHRNRTKAGFTLVELLVVIGIIGILIAILLPALTRVQKQSKALACLSNLRQINQAFLMYCNEHKNYTMTNAYNGGTEQYWWQALQPYWGVKKQINPKLVTGGGDDDPNLRQAMRVILCPAADVVPTAAVGKFGDF